MSKQGKKVLVVEDEESFITALQVGLTREGFEVVVVDDGAKACKMQVLNEHPGGHSFWWPYRGPKCM